jgi:hypothetical protein
MSIAKRGPKTLGLSLIAVLGLMAFIATGAQANWEVEGKELTANETVAGKGHTVWGLSVEKKNLEIQCTTTASTSTLLAKSGTAEGETKLTGCTTFSPIGSGKVNSNCKPKEPIALGFKILLILHNGNVYLLLEGKKTGGKLGTIEFSELCALTESSELLGSRVDECGHLIEPGHTWVFLDCANGEARHYIRPASRLLFLSDLFKFGSNEAEVSGITELELSGANKGKTWGGSI